LYLAYVFVEFLFIQKRPWPVPVHGIILFGQFWQLLAGSSPNELYVIWVICGLD